MLPNWNYGISQASSRCVQLPEVFTPHISSTCCFPTIFTPPKPLLVSGLSTIKPYKIPEIIEPPIDLLIQPEISCCPAAEDPPGRKTADGIEHAVHASPGLLAYGGYPFVPRLPRELTWQRELRQSFVAVLWKTQGWFKTKDMLKLAMDQYWVLWTIISL